MDDTARLEGRIHALNFAFAQLFMETAQLHARTTGKADAPAFAEKMLRRLERQVPLALAGFEADGNAAVSAGFEEGMEHLRGIIAIVGELDGD